MSELRTFRPIASSARITAIARRVTDLSAAARHDFPKPDIQVVQMGQNPIRTFAAPGMYVSLADILAIRPPRASGWYLPFAVMASVACGGLRSVSAEVNGTRAWPKSGRSTLISPTKRLR